MVQLRLEYKEDVEKLKVIKLRVKPSVTQVMVLV